MAVAALGLGEFHCAALQRLRDAVGSVLPIRPGISLLGLSRRRGCGLRAGGLVALAGRAGLGAFRARGSWRVPVVWGSNTGLLHGARGLSVSGAGALSGEVSLPRRLRHSVARGLRAGGGHQVETTRHRSGVDAPCLDRNRAGRVGGAGTSVHRLQRVAGKLPRQRRLFVDQTCARKFPARCRGQHDVPRWLSCGGGARARAVAAHQKVCPRVRLRRARADRGGWSYPYATTESHPARAAVHAAFLVGRAGEAATRHGPRIHHAGGGRISNLRFEHECGKGLGVQTSRRVVQPEPDRRGAEGERLVHLADARATVGRADALHHDEPTARRAAGFSRRQPDQPR